MKFIEVPPNGLTAWKLNRRWQKIFEDLADTFAFAEAEWLVISDDALGQQLSEYAS